MADWLLVRLARDGSRPVGWIAASASGQALDTVHARDAEGLADAAAGRRVVLVAPAADVLHLSATLPAGSESRLAQVAPFALEDQVADDLELLHFAVGRPRAGTDATTDVDVVSRTLLEGWLATARDAALSPVAVYGEAALLPVLPGQLTMLADDTQLIVRREGQRPLVLPAADPQMALDLALGSEAAPEGLLVTVYSDAMDWPRWKDVFEAWRPRLHALRVQLLPNGSLPLLGPDVAGAQAINLLQGTYAARRPGLEHWRVWRVAAALLAALLVVHVAGATVAWRRLRAQERELDVQIQQTFSQAMPGVVSGGKPRERLERRLSQLIAAMPGRDGLLPMLSAVGTVMRGGQGLQLASLEFHSGSLDLKLSAPDAASVARVAQTLTAAGYPTQVLPGSARDKVYEGRLQVRSSAK